MKIFSLKRFATIMFFVWSLAFVNPDVYAQCPPNCSSKKNTSRNKSEPQTKQNKQPIDGSVLGQAKQVRAELEKQAASLKGDPLYWFNKQYFYVTDAILERAEKGEFEYPEIVLKEIVEFHKPYAENLNNWRSGRKDLVADHWKTGFEETNHAFELDPRQMFRGGAGKAIIEGAKAHIRGDLPNAIADVFLEAKKKNPNLKMSDLRSDFDKILSTFEKAQDSIRKELPVNEQVKLGLAKFHKADKLALKTFFDFELRKERLQAFEGATQIVEETLVAQERNELLQVKSLVDKGAINRNSLSPQMRKQLEQFEATQKIIGDSVKSKATKAATTSETSKPSGRVTVLKSDGSRTELNGSSSKSKSGGAKAFLTDHPDLHNKVLSGNLPPESKSQPIEVTSGTVQNASQIPYGWIVCQCPAVHVGLGAFFQGVQYHPNNYHCP